MIRRTITKIGPAWDNARFNMYDEMEKEFKDAYGKDDPIEANLDRMEEWWVRLYGTRLDLKGLRSDVPYMPYVEFRDREQLAEFMLRWS